MINYVTDDHYTCFYCKKSLVYDGYQRCVVETETKIEHICNPPTSNTHQHKEIYLGSQKDSAKLARQYDEYFTSKKLSDLKSEAKQLERYNKNISYDQKQRMMGASSSNTNWTDMPSNHRRRTK